MTINERIKELRKKLGLTQIEFAEKIGLKKSAASWIEKNGSNVTTSNIQLICSTFNVSEEWLLHGTGDMFTNSDEQALNQMIKKYNMTDDEIAFISHWMEQPDEVRRVVMDYAMGVAEKIARARGLVIQGLTDQESPEKPNQGTKKDVSDSDTPSMDNHARNANAADTGAALPPSTAPADTSRPAGLSDEEWQLVQMSREEKEQASPTSSATSSAIG